MSKFASLFTIGSLLFFFLFSHTCAARPVPELSKDDASSVKTQHVGFETESGDVEESCEGVGEEECLMRRTLAAHVDYIYTQKKQP